MTTTDATETPAAGAARERVRVERITVGEIEDFTRRFFAAGSSQITAPVSLERAMAYARNPHADASDVALLVAYAGDRCVGYQGLIPLPFRGQEGATTVIWGSAAYVVPEYRKRLVAIHLIKAMIGLGRDLALSGYTDVVHDVYQGVGFVPAGPLSYPVFTPARLNLPGAIALRAERRAPQGSRRRRLAGSLQAWTRRAIHPVTTTLYGGYLERWARKRLRHVQIREVDRVAPPRGAEPAADADTPCFPRSADTVNWMLSWPWIRSGGGQTDPPYHFADFRDHFRFHAVEVLAGDDRHLSTVVFSDQEQRGHRFLRVTDLWTAPGSTPELGAWVALLYGARLRVDRIEGLPGMEGAFRQAPFSRLLLHRSERRYLFRPASHDSPLGSALGRLRLDPSDGDCAFT